LIEVLDEHGVDIAHLNSIISTWRVYQAHNNCCHAITVTLVQSLTSLTELFEVANLCEKQVLLLQLVGSIALIELPLGLNHSFKSFFVGSKFVDLDLSTLIIKV
jgi:hypothetical protein